MTTRGVYPVPAEYGDRVRYTAMSGMARAVGERGEGVFVLCWLGVEEVWDVLRDDGIRVHLYPCFGDTMEQVGPEGAAS